MALVRALNTVVQKLGEYRAATLFQPDLQRSVFESYELIRDILQTLTADEN